MSSYKIQDPGLKIFPPFPKGGAGGISLVSRLSLDCDYMKVERQKLEEATFKRGS